MNRRTLRATGIVLTGMLLAGDPVSMIYAAPVAGVSVATTAEAVAVGTGSSSPSAGVSLAVADCLVASNEEVAQEAAAQQEQVSENETPVVESEYADIAIAQVDNYVNVRTEPNTESEVVGKLYNNSAATILQTTEDGWYEITSGNVTGYVKCEYVVAGDEELAKSVSTRYAKVTTTTLYVRRKRQSVRRRQRRQLAPERRTLRVHPVHPAPQIPVHPTVHRPVQTVRQLQAMHVSLSVIRMYMAEAALRMERTVPDLL